MHTPSIPKEDTGTQSPPRANVPLIDSRYRAPFVMVTALFFLWAMPNNLNDVLIRQFLMWYISPNILMGTFALTNVLLLAVAITKPGWIGLWAIMATSFCMSLMYPTIFALGLKQLGPNTTLGASILVMAIIGGAVLTPAVGWVAERTHSMADAFLVPLLCYLVVAWFAFLGSRIRVSQADVLHQENLHSGTI
ncbi:hypothetical protein [Tunturiibacter gelidiferens]|uniref:hypothetical protein n=1 Tax=Tunturiibacter gelidiferens TaxID=3069689 RepID=UPI003D9AF4CA